MKKLSIYLSALMLFNVTCNAEDIPAISEHAQSRKEAVEIITGIADGLAELIIAHKQTLSTEEKKQRTILLIEKITEAITTIIIRTKAKQHYKSTIYCDEHALHQIIEHVALHMIQVIESEQGETN